MPRRTLRDYRAFTNVPGAFGDRPESEVHRIPATTPSPEEAFADTRARFSERLKEQLGFDPVAFSPSDEARKVAEDGLPALIEQTFGRGVTFRGIRNDPKKMNRLSRLFIRHENDLQKQFSAKQKRFRSEYDTAIKAFDADAAARGATVRKAAKALVPKQPAPVTWTTATKQLNGRFGKQDALGNIIITKELQGMNRVAQRMLVDLKKSRNVGPLEAVVMAEDFARQQEEDFFSQLETAVNDKNKQDAIKRGYKKMFRYVPTIRTRR